MSLVPFFACFQLTRTREKVKQNRREAGKKRLYSSVNTDTYWLTPTWPEKNISMEQT